MPLRSRIHWLPMQMQRGLLFSFSELESTLPTHSIELIYRLQFRVLLAVESPVGHLNPVSITKAFVMRMPYVRGTLRVTMAAVVAKVSEAMVTNAKVKTLVQKINSKTVFF